MANSGLIQGGVTQRTADYRSWIYWREVSQDIANNRTKINVQVLVDSDSSNYDWNGTVSGFEVTINGTKYTRGSFNSNSNSGFSYSASNSPTGRQAEIIDEREVWVTHNTNGTKTVNMSSSFSLPSGGWGPGDVSISGSGTLDTIAREWNRYKRTSFLSSYNRGSFINTITGSSSAFTDGQRNSDGYWYEKGEAYTNYSKGSYVETVTAEEGTYPDDGRVGDYYYTKRNIADTPTLTSPNGGETWNEAHTITWDGIGPGVSYQIQLTTDNGNNWRTIVANTAENATSYEYNFIDEPQTSLAKIRVRAFDGEVYSDWDESNGVFTIQHNVAPNEPSNLSPSSGVVDRTEVSRLSWQHNDPNTNDPQTKFDLQWREQGASTWNTITKTSNKEYTDVSANVFPNALIEWRVRTYDTSGLAGPYSSIAIFQAAEPTDAPIITAPTNPVNIANPTVQWTSSEQTAYQIIIEDSVNTVVWDTGIVNSINRARTVGIDLLNGAQYTIRVRVMDGTGLWSTYASLNINVSYTQPAKPNMSLTTGHSHIIVQISNPTPSGTQPTVTRNALYRREENGSFIRIANDLPPNVVFEDYAVASGKVYEYRVRSWGDNGTYSESNVGSNSVTFKGVWLHDVTDTDTLHHFMADGSGRDTQWAAQSANIYFAGRKSPVTYFGDQEEDVLTVTLEMLRDWEDYERLNQIIKAKNIVCYRDGRGRKIFGTITELPINDTRYGNETTIKVTRTSYSEVV
ncbi:hypothetical protein HNQ94_000400 [Salirhabdus euzebyi]|uniref:Fibronectin type-III domain-containing protein n=1 Tax=Salirhabdus euzebyi TaxID=394506 RepID=A0A841PT26_9BACI|nr:hypothetical protein [Salirhabdus euzebyi]MBB6451979.1 hypothetical protein [Salirhabdus euzebyi]